MNSDVQFEDIECSFVSLILENQYMLSVIPRLKFR